MTDTAVRGEPARPHSLPSLTRGDIVQVVAAGHAWHRCLVIVDEARPWGVQGYLTVPTNDAAPNGDAFTRLAYDAIEYVGSAVIIRTD